MCQVGSVFMIHCSQVPKIQILSWPWDLASPKVASGANLRVQFMRISHSRFRADGGTPLFYSHESQWENLSVNLFVLCVKTNLFYLFLGFSFFQIVTEFKLGRVVCQVYFVQELQFLFRLALECQATFNVLGLKGERDRTTREWIKDSGPGRCHFLRCIFGAREFGVDLNHLRRTVVYGWSISYQILLQLPHY